MSVRQKRAEKDKTAAKAGKHKTVSGYFQDLEQLALAVARIEHYRYPGTYATINPVNPALNMRKSSPIPASMISACWCTNRSSLGALQAMRRQGNTLSPVMRAAFHKGILNSMVKNSPAKATGAHISIVGNITKEELFRAMLVDEMDNGFAKRFLWACSRRSKCLPEGGRMWEVIESEAFRELQKDFNRIHYAVKGPVRRDGDASDIWGYDDKPDAGI